MNEFVLQQYCKLPTEFLKFKIIRIKKERKQFFHEEKNKINTNQYD